MSRIFNETFVAVAADRFAAQFQDNLLQNNPLKGILTICQKRLHLCVRSRFHRAPTRYAPSSVR